MITWRERIDKAYEAWNEWDNMPTELRIDRVFKVAGVRDLVVENQELRGALEWVTGYEGSEIDELLSSYRDRVRTDKIRETLDG